MVSAVAVIFCVDVFMCHMSYLAFNFASGAKVGIFSVDDFLNSDSSVETGLVHFSCYANMPTFIFFTVFGYFLCFKIGITEDDTRLDF